jgi:Kinesin-like protein
VFKEIKPLITSVLDGYNVCIFAYGQTGSGKTYTMEGPPQDRGVFHKAIEELFKMIKERHQHYEYSVEISLMEIYNEQLRDLFGEQTVKNFNCQS